MEVVEIQVFTFIRLRRFNMRHWLVGAAAAAILCFAGTVQADTQLYSFESGTDGFGPNGGGITVTQDTIGATDGTHSLKTSVVTGATFASALTTNVPAALNNPPGVDAVKFDMTIDANDGFTGAFDVVGVTVYGFNAGLGQFGLQAQFAPQIHVDGKSPNTYLDQLIPLTGATNPLDFTTNQSFNQIFTAGTPGPNQLNVSGFQFFINKSNDAPTTVYIDNVRVVGTVPEPACCTLVAVGLLGIVSMGRRARWLASIW